MKLALIYDRLNKIGGAEEILKSLHDLWPSSTWHTSLHNPKTAKFTSDWNVKSSILNNIPLINKKHEAIPYLMPYIFENFDFDDYDVVISISSAEAKGIITKPHTFHLNYCLTPTRYLWSHMEEYLASSQYGLVKKIGAPIVGKIIKLMKTWDLVAAQRPDEMIAISEHVKKRVKKYYNRNIAVIYPPVDIDKFNTKSTIIPEEKNYFLTVSRLVPYKNTEFLIKIFNKTNKTLIIIGDGADRRRLQKMANKNIIFKRILDDNALVGYYQNCIAFLQANEEDFGITMVEAQAAGKPVIAVKKGGALEIITPKTGFLIEPTQDAFLQALDRVERIEVSQLECKRNASRFSKERFEKQFKKKLEELWQKQQKI